MSQDGFTEGDLNRLLRERHAPKQGSLREWLYLPQVRNATGGSATRSADGIAVNLWESRGHEIHGFEIKVSRSDWLRELKDPKKADAFHRHCHRWWIVAPKGVVVKEELPGAWGLLEPRGVGLRAVVRAGKTDVEALTRGFMAAVLRRALECESPEAEIESRIKKAEAAAYDRGMKNGEHLAGIEMRNLKAEVENARKFAKLAGVDFGWGPELERDARNFAMVRRQMNRVGSLSGLSNQLRVQMKSLGDLVEALEKVGKPLGDADGGF